MKRRKRIIATRAHVDLRPFVKEVELENGDLGWAYQDGSGYIEIDPRQDSKDYLDTLIHEMLHIFFPNLSEQVVSKLANKMSAVIWKKRYRRIHK